MHELLILALGSNIISSKQVPHKKKNYVLVNGKDSLLLRHTLRKHLHVSFDNATGQAFNETNITTVTYHPSKHLT